MELTFGRELGYYLCSACIQVIHHYGTQRHIVEICGITDHHDILRSQNPSLVGYKTG